MLTSWLYFDYSLTERSLIITCRILTGISRIACVKFQFFFNIPAICCLKHFRAKFREILTSGSGEIGVFPRIKAETHNATNRGNTSRRQVASCALMLRQSCCAYFVAAILRTNSNQFEFVRQIAATKCCRSDNDFHMSREAIW